MKTKIVSFIRGHKLITAAIILVGLVFIIAAVISFQSRRTSTGFENREQAREEQRTGLDDDFKVKAAEFEARRQRAGELERENKRLRSEIDRARAEVAQAKRERDEIARKYEKDQKSLESITDYDGLRRVNCERRSKLGYPCEQ